MFNKYKNYIETYGFSWFNRKVKNKLIHVMKDTLLFSKARYNFWRKKKAITTDEMQYQRKYKFVNSPLVSIVVPVYNTPARYLNELVDSILAQTYSQWELCLANGNSTKSETISTLEELSAKDERIKVINLTSNGGVSENTNTAIQAAQGKYIVFADHDDLLTPNALFEVVKAFEEKNADFVYSDEDKIDEHSRSCFAPHLKPDFSLDYLRCTNYICHISAVKKSLALKIGGLNPLYDGSQDHDFNLRVAETNSKIVHIPKILYHWRQFKKSLSNSNLDKCTTASQNCIQAHLDRSGLKGTVKVAIFGNTVHYDLIEKPLVSVYIPNGRDREDQIRYLKNHSDYSNFEVIEDANKAQGKYIIFLGESVYPSDGNWIDNLLMYQQFDDIGAVGGAVYDRRKKAIHRGIHFIKGIPLYTFFNTSDADWGNMNKALCVHNVSAVDTSFSIVNTSDYLNYIENHLNTDFIDYCLYLQRNKKRIVMLPEATAYSKLTCKHDYYVSQHSYDVPFTEDPFYNPNALATSNSWNIDYKSIVNL